MPSPAQGGRREQAQRETERHLVPLWPDPVEHAAQGDCHVTAQRRPNTRTPSGKRTGEQATRMPPYWARPPRPSWSARRGCRRHHLRGAAAGSAVGSGVGVGCLIDQTKVDSHGLAGQSGHRAFGKAVDPYPRGVTTVRSPIGRSHGQAIHAQNHCDERLARGIVTVPLRRPYPVVRHAGRHRRSAKTPMASVPTCRTGSGVAVVRVLR